jgi:hypothetical protein
MSHPEQITAFDRGQRVRVQVPGLPGFATVRCAVPGDDAGSRDLILVDVDDRRHEVVTAALRWPS